MRLLAELDNKEANGTDFVKARYDCGLIVNTKQFILVKAQNL